MVHDNETAPVFRGQCPAPFLEVSQFPIKGGYVPGRVCSNIYQGLTCCLPCPVTEWIYPPSFMVWYKAAQGLSAVGLAICLFLIFSWMVLPNERNKSHYLGICLVLGIMLECLAFVIPLGAPHNPCYNEITPNDMTSNLTCAFSGACLVLGGLAISAWIAIRSLSMHLQICWDVVPGTKFFYFANTLGWGFAITVFIIAMCVTGVSYRFGDTCHINAKDSMADFWGPILTVAGIAAILQISTLLYCVKVYLKSMWSDDQEQSYGSSGLPSYQGSSRARSAKVVYQRVSKVMWLQWRSVTIVLLLLTDVIFFAIVWIELDSAISNIGSGHTEHIMAFLACILVNPSLSARSKCFPLGQKVLVNEKTCVALLIMLSLTGIQTGILLTRLSLFKSWAEFFRTRFSKNKEFVSLDAKRFSADPRGIGGANSANFNIASYPMNPMGGATSPSPAKRVESVDTYSSRDLNSPFGLHGHNSFDTNNSSATAAALERNYRQPRMSFSTPRPAGQPLTPPPSHSRPNPWDSGSLAGMERPSTAAGHYYRSMSPTSQLQPHTRLSNDQLYNQR